MDAKFLFDQFPEATECFVASHDAFLNEEDAKAYSKHFNVEYKTVHKSEVYPDFVQDSSETVLVETNLGEAITAQLSKKDKAKIEAIAKAEADAQAEADAKAQADAETEAEAKAQADATPPAVVDAP